MQISIYKTQKLSAKNLLVKLLEKSFEENKTSEIIIENEELKKDLDKFLWNFNKESFLPHKVIKKENKKDQTPIVITSKTQNHKNISFILVKNLPENISDIKSERIVIINDKNEKEEQLLLKNFLENNLNFIKENPVEVLDQNEIGKWENKKEIAII